MTDSKRLQGTTDAAARVELGRERRKVVPRSAIGDWSPAPDRRDPIDVLAAQEATRVPELVAIRRQRMAASPFAFFRGAAAIFAGDVAPRPAIGLPVQLCADAHLANFGTFASPERVLVFDINDFDETLPGSFELDLMRLAASFEVAGRANRFDAQQRRGVVDALARSYCRSMGEFAAMTNLDVWYSDVTVQSIATRWAGEASRSLIAAFDRNVRKAESKDRLKAFSRLVTVDGGQPRFRSDPPLLEPVRELFPDDVHDALWDAIRRAFDDYSETLLADRRLLLDRYRFVDLARKVVGVGSVGTRCWVVLLIGRGDDDPLFLQVKEAEASVLEPYLGPSTFEQHGQRVVEGQRVMQATPDVLLGWARTWGIDGRDHDYYFRQLWDWKGSVAVDAITHIHLALYAEVCGHSLARAHARSGDPVAISAYLGHGKTVAGELARFAARYADQNEADHRAFSEWVTSGAAPMPTGDERTTMATQG